jgi:hypothetical protein
VFLVFSKRIPGGILLEVYLGPRRSGLSEKWTEKWSEKTFKAENANTLMLNKPFL